MSRNKLAPVSPYISIYLILLYILFFEIEFEIQATYHLSTKYITSLRCRNDSNLLIKWRDFYTIRRDSERHTMNSGKWKKCDLCLLVLLSRQPVWLSSGISHTYVPFLTDTATLSPSSSRTHTHSRSHAIRTLCM